VVKETGAGQVGLAIAVTAKDKVYQAVKGDKRAIMDVNEFGAELAVDIALTGGFSTLGKGKTAAKVTKEATEEIVEQAAKRAQSSTLRARVLANLEESAAARAASNFPKVERTNQQLLDVTARASRITDRLIAQGSTHWARVYSNPALGGVRVANIAAKKPNLVRSIIRGNIMDDVAKQLASKLDTPFLRITPRGARGPDFLVRFLDTSWDVTTPGSWPRHLTRYANDPFDLRPLLY
jgi:hypothetical protein